MAASSYQQASEKPLVRPATIREILGEPGGIAKLGCDKAVTGAVSLVANA